MSQYVLTVLLVLRVCVVQESISSTQGVGVPFDRLRELSGVQWCHWTNWIIFVLIANQEMYRVSRIRALTFQSSLLKRLEELLYIPAFQSSKGCRPSYFYKRDMHTLDHLIISVVLCTVRSQSKDFCTSDAWKSFKKLKTWLSSCPLSVFNGLSSDKTYCFILYLNVFCFCTLL